MRRGRRKRRKRRKRRRRRRRKRGRTMTNFVEYTHDVKSLTKMK